VKLRLMHAPDRVSTHPESGMKRALYDCASVPLTPTGPIVRLVIATHPATESAPTVGVERDGAVYELFVSTLPSPAFTASDVLDLASRIAARLRPCWPTKTRSRTLTDGILTPPVERRFAQILAQWMRERPMRTGATTLSSRAAYN
jgi:hypothetical protein